MTEDSREPKTSLKGPVRWIAVFATAILLGMACCGLDPKLYPAAGIGGGPLAGIGFWLIAPSVIGFGISILVLFVMLVAKFVEKK